mmetsp:Transcript_3473/g.10771  ORF Transcript_3473/g.10771 Transcript_3473/m.10771 type:complete len:131 (-) Transcript_3473:311-703(-)
MSALEVTVSGLYYIYFKGNWQPRIPPTNSSNCCLKHDGNSDLQLVRGETNVRQPLNDCSCGCQLCRLPFLASIFQEELATSILVLFGSSVQIYRCLSLTCNDAAMVVAVCVHVCGHCSPGPNGPCTFPLC